MLLHVSTLAGPLPPVQVTAEATVGELKLCIQDVYPEARSKELCIMKSQQESGSDHIELIDVDSSLSSYGVHDGCELAVIFEEFRPLEKADCIRMLTTYESMAGNSEQYVDAVASIIACRSGSLDFSKSFWRIEGLSEEIFFADFISSTLSALNTTRHCITSLNISLNFVSRLIYEALQLLHLYPCITDLDLSAIKTISSPESASEVALAEFIRTNSTIRKLNISENRDFDTLSFAEIANAIAINHTITDLDMSCISPKLELRGPRKKRVDVAPEIPQAMDSMITCNTSIRKLNISNIEFLVDCFQHFVDSFAFNSTITNLDISGYSHSTSEFASIPKLISTLKSVSHLRINCYWCKISDDQITYAISQALRLNTSIIELEMDCKFICTETLPSFAGMLSDNETVQTLALKKIAGDGVSIVAEALSRNIRVSDVKLCFDGRVHESHSVALANLIRCNSNITKLDLSDSDFSEDSLSIALAEALGRNTSIQHLNLNRCKIGSAGALALAKMVNSNQTISNLCLDSNCFEKSGTIAIAESLKHNCTINRILFGAAHRMSSDRIFRRLPLNSHSDSVTARAIADIIACNSTVVDLRIPGLGQPCCDPIQAREIVETLKQHPSITSLDLSEFFGEGAEVVDAIASLISSNTTITQLSINRNAFGTHGLIAIAEALKLNTTIKHIMICCDEFYQAAQTIMQYYCEMLSLNTSLKTVTLYCHDIAFFIHDHKTTVAVRKAEYKFPQFSREEFFN